jgi:hypothetical protein
MLTRAPDLTASPFTDVRAQFDHLESFLRSEEAAAMTHSELERYLEEKGREFRRSLLQAHLELRSPGEAQGEVRDSQGAERTPTPTVLGTVQVHRKGYGAEVQPLDGELNLPPDQSAHFPTVPTTRSDAATTIPMEPDHLLFRPFLSTPSGCLWFIPWQQRVRPRTAFAAEGQQPGRPRGPPDNRGGDYLIKLRPFLHHDRCLAAGAPIAQADRRYLPSPRQEPTETDRSSLGVHEAESRPTTASATSQRKHRLATPTTRSCHQNNQFPPENLSSSHRSLNSVL